MKRILNSKLFYFLLGCIVTICTTVYAANTFFSYNISFKPDNDNWDAENVEDALNDLYNQCNVSFEQSNDFYYTGESQTYTIPKNGRYKLEVWGAQGGSATCGSLPGGYGGYSVGIAELRKDVILYINVGGQGKMASKGNTPVEGGYNGGGASRISDGQGSSGECHGSGGGATHIALEEGKLSELSSHAINGRILIVAGGGGGSAYYLSYYPYYCYGSGGHGGGYNGANSYNYAVNSCAQSSTSAAYGGLQVPDTRTGSYMNIGTFGQGGYMNHYGETGGGGGYYGGSSSAALGAGGGSGYIGSSYLITGTKHMYCYNCPTATDPDIYTISKGTSSCHSNSVESDCAKEGNGHARITYVGN